VATSAFGVTEVTAQVDSFEIVIDNLMTLARGIGGNA